MNTFEDNSPSQFSRRSFMKVFAFGATAVGSSALLATIQGCSKNNNAPTATPSTGQ
jgi:hypothetical protein